ncbi:chorismate mutase [Clostridium algidicarnis]|uniref:chorismate mutase n=1 Tax=Clostridium algidicarnis TaxID=37659 RepID=UPI001C0AA68D|nr:chorismate mutase [Clostridium algidicarnis]MBU3195403.1 chorismate mutase [Clostridium algidicarnis]MBU3208362.1 chorismate mutase [Clostridium algidicarnis]MBU3227406.1 chorismate mutase [Clostridium algidicarnis]MBU3251187.1 chorismate mutase [Clostridium algidicarnis]
MLAIRGATTIEDNEKKYIKESTIELIDTMIKKNNLTIDKIISIVFSCTKDITKDYPGKYLREALGLTTTAIMHFNEMEVEKEKYLPLCIRVLVLYDSPKAGVKDIYPIYLKGATNLRPDLKRL